MDFGGIVLKWCEFVPQNMKCLQYSSIFQIFQVFLLQEKKFHFLHIWINKFINFTDFLFKVITKYLKNYKLTEQSISGSLSKRTTYILICHFACFSYKDFAYILEGFDRIRQSLKVNVYQVNANIFNSCYSDAIVHTQILRGTNTSVY